MRIYPVIENLIGSAVSEILRYKQTNTQTKRHKDILLLLYNDISICLANSLYLLIQYYYIYFQCG